MISDIHARQQALQADQSFIVQAPAGSGKTGLLVYRMLTLLNTVERPEQILAITFTRKAMSEMRERLLHLLKQAEQDQSSSNPFEQQGIELAHAVLKRDQQKNWRLLDTPQQLQIQTIDGFCAKLTGHMPWLSRLGDKARTTNKPQAHYAAAVEQLFNELLSHESSSDLSNALQTVLLELDFDYAKTRKLFINMLAKRDQWLRHLLQHDFASLRSSLEKTWRDITQSHLHELNQILPLSMQQALLARVARAAELIEVKETPLSISDKLNQLEMVGVNIDLWRAIKFILLTNDNKGFRKRLDKNCGFPTIDKQHKQAMMDLLAELRDDEVLRVALAELDHLPSANFSDEDWQQLCALEQVLKALAGLLQLRFRAVGECDHSEVTQRANLALQDLSSPTELALRMDYQLQHILVDEFQDTSHSQIALLKKLTLGWDLDVLSDNGAKQTLFLVGDPMQSIYRFREADVSLFLRVVNDANELFPNLIIKPLRLTENFRSSGRLVAWFNHTFKQSFPTRDQIMPGAISYASATSSQAMQDSDPQIQCLAVLDKQQQAEQVVVAIQRTQRELAKSIDLTSPKIAVLVRSRTHLTHLLPALRAANIDYVGVEIQPLKETQAILDVLALCKAICRLDDRVSWLALLRGPWCGLNLVEIQPLVTQSDLPIWHQLKHADLTQFSVEAQSRLQRLITIMASTQQQRQQVSLHSITRWAWQQLGGEHTLFDASLDDINALFDLIAELEQGGDIASLMDLEQALDGLYAKPAQHHQASVVVSTMHKSKGLQYDTVILPNLASPARAEEKSVMMWAEHIDQSGDAQLLLAPIRMQQGEGSHYDYLRALEKQRSRNEAIRLMYVACTRAERQLVLIGQLNVNDKTGAVNSPVQSSLLASVWPALEDKFVATLDLAAAERDVDESDLSQTLSRLPSNFVLSQADSIRWQPQQQLNAQTQETHSLETVLSDDLEYEWASSVAKAVGIVLHDWLQFNSHTLFDSSFDPAQKKRWRSELIQLNVPPEKVNACLSRLEKALKYMQVDDNAHFIFKDYKEQKNEYALSCLENNMVKTYRIDRTFVDEHNVRWIVDYKTTVTHADDVTQFIDQQVAERHHAQLQKYADLMSQIDARPIKLGVYFPLLKEWRVWDYNG